MRALINIAGMERARQARQDIRPQLYFRDEAHAASGRQWSRNRPAQAGTSSGTKRCMTRVLNPNAGRRCASTRADVTVPVVRSIDTFGSSFARAASTGSTEVISPTLAACSHGSASGGWPWRAVDATAFGEAVSDFLAACYPIAQQQPQRGRGKRRSACPQWLHDRILPSAARTRARSRADLSDLVHRSGDFRHSFSPGVTRHRYGRSAHHNTSAER